MSTFSFFANETVSLEKRINLTAEPLQTSSADLDCQYEINKCAEWITSNMFQKVIS